MTFPNQVQKRAWRLLFQGGDDCKFFEFFCKFLTFCRQFWSPPRRILNQTRRKHLLRSTQEIFTNLETPWWPRHSETRPQKRQPIRYQEQSSSPSRTKMPIFNRRATNFRKWSAFALSRFNLQQTLLSWLHLRTIDQRLLVSRCLPQDSKILQRMSSMPPFKCEPNSNRNF